MKQFLLKHKQYIFMLAILPTFPILIFNDMPLFLSLPAVTIQGVSFVILIWDLIKNR